MTQDNEEKLAEGQEKLAEKEPSPVSDDAVAMVSRSSVAASDSVSTVW